MIWGCGFSPTHQAIGSLRNEDTGYNHHHGAGVVLVKPGLTTVWCIYSARKSVFSPFECF